MKKQRGGTIFGFICGLVVGLGIALGVAMYVTNVPSPFMSKVQARSADPSDAETKKSKDWDPNALINGKPLDKASAPQESTPVAAPPIAGVASAAPEPRSNTNTDTKTDTKTNPKAVDKAAASADPLGALVKAKSGNADGSQVAYFVQLGAFRSTEDAQAQRAKLALAGVDAKVTEREQGGLPLFRVRLGPFDKMEEAERAKDKLDKAGNETALVKVQR